MPTTRAAMPRVAVDLGRRARVLCVVARTADEQAQGLQDRPPLGEGGMLFPFYPPRATTFHMGRVSYPIDIVFADASGRVAKIVHVAQPGSRARWSVPVASAVVELAGGQAGRLGVRVGDMLRVAGRRVGVQTYNLLRTLTEAGVVEGDGASGLDLEDGYYSKEPLHAPPSYGGAPPAVPAYDRFQDHELPDQAFPDAMNQGTGEQGAGNWEQTQGYDPGYQPYADPLSTDMEAKDTMDGDSAPAAVRMSAGWRAPGRRTGRGAQFQDDIVDYSDALQDGPKQPYQIDLAKFGQGILTAAFRSGMQWKPSPTDPNAEQLLVDPGMVGSWLHSLGLPEDQTDGAFFAITTQEGLTTVGEVFTYAGQADSAKVEQRGDQLTLVLTRGKRG